jgi:hypothetical protein
VAGAPGDTHFIKGHMALQQHVRLLDFAPLLEAPIPLPVSLGLCLGFGAVRSLGEDAKRPVRIIDRCVGHVETDTSLFAR